MNGMEIEMEMKRLGLEISNMFAKIIKDGELNSIFKLAIIKVTLNTYLAEHTKRDPNFSNVVDEIENLYMKLIDNVKIEEFKRK